MEWLLFLVFCINTFTKKLRNADKRYISVMFIVLATMMMFRSMYVGNDTYKYVTLFEEISKTNNLDSYIESSRYETGFVYLCRLLSYIWNDPQILFIVTGAFTAFAFGRFIYKYSDIPWMSVLMFLTLQFFDLSLSGVRQILSVSMLLFAYDYMIDRKLLKFSLIVLLASTIHGSAVMFFLLYPLTAKKRGVSFFAVSIGVAVCIFVGFDILIKGVEVIFPQYVKYLTGDSKSYSSSATVASFFMFLLWLAVYVAGTGYAKKYVERSGLSAEAENRKIYIDSVHEIAVWMGVIMLFLSMQGTILNRFKYIFSVPIIVYYPNMLKNISQRPIQQTIIFISCMVFIAYISIIHTFRPEWQSSFPYTFFWEIY